MNTELLYANKYTHYIIGKRLRKYKVKTILDVGGIKRFKEGFKVTDANIKKGIDGCDLPYKNNSFDAVISIATIEHVLDYKKFIAESIRVSKKVVVHFLPLGKIALQTDVLKKKVGRAHHTTYIPDIKDIKLLLSSYKYEIIPLISIASHLFYLVSLYPKLDKIPIWNFISKYGNECYGWMIFAEVEKK